MSCGQWDLRTGQSNQEMQATTCVYATKGDRCGTEACEVRDQFVNSGTYGRDRLG